MPSLAIRPLTTELQAAAMSQCSEVPERLADDVEQLKLWIKQQPHLRARTDDQFLVAFLRGCKNSLERCKSKIDQLYTLRTKYPEFFSYKGLTIDKILAMCRLGVFIYLPTPLYENGPRIGIFRMGAYSPSEYTFGEVMRSSQIIQDITMLEDDYAVVNGIISICDLSDTTVAHMLQMTPGTLKKLAVWTEEAAPFRPQATHFINTPPGFETVFNIFKPMLSKKQQGRLFVHGSKMELLHEQIPKKYLPREYGGENGSVDDIIQSWEKRILAFKSFIEEDSKYGTDESLRLGKTIDFDAIFGTDGSFRKLDFD